MKRSPTAIYDHQKQDRHRSNDENEPIGAKSIAKTATRDPYLESLNLQASQKEAVVLAMGVEVDMTSEVALL